MQGRDEQADEAVKEEPIVEIPKEDAATVKTAAVLDISKEKATNEGFVTAKEMYQTCFVITTVVSLLIVFFYHQYAAPRLAVCDFNSYMKNVSQAIAAGAMNEKQVDEAVQAAADVVNGQRRNVVVLSGDIVLGEAKTVKRLVLPEIKIAAPPAPAAAAPALGTLQTMPGFSPVPAGNK